jgi:predicted transcriptional regulator of viral defense system
MSAHSGKWTGSSAFFATHPVFTHGEFAVAHTARGRSESTSNAILARYVASGRLIRVRRGLYAAVPVGRERGGFVPDAFLVAAKSQDDAVLGYHTALSFHGAAYSVWWRFQVITSRRVRRFTHGNEQFVCIQAPTEVRTLPDFGGGVSCRPYGGAEVRVTTIERTLVDLMHAPQHGGGWEEIWRSLETVEFLDLGAVVEHALRMRTALTAARVGFFLEQHRKQWMVEDKHLAPLLGAKPKQPLHWDRRREPGTLQTRWNLLVPDMVLHRLWEEPSEAV